MIGSSEEKDGLYWVSGNKISPMNQFPHKLSFTVSSNSEVLLRHKRLSHPSLFTNKEKIMLQCEYCILAKQIHNTYLTQPYTLSKPFCLIHSDIWGPARISNLSGAQWFVTFIDDHTRVCWVYPVF